MLVLMLHLSIFLSKRLGVERKQRRQWKRTKARCRDKHGDSAV